jgi:hypothetical protein
MLACILTRTPSTPLHPSAPKTAYLKISQDIMDIRKALNQKTPDYAAAKVRCFGWRVGAKLSRKRRGGCESSTPRGGASSQPLKTHIPIL